VLKWLVKLIKRPTRDDFPAGYFPRGFHYKKDALKLVEEVKQKGGDAIVEPARKKG
jgi:hypothetical protein